MSRKEPDIRVSDLNDMMSDNELAALSKSSDTAAARRALSALLSRYLRLVRKKAYSFSCDYAEPEDLAQEGMLSLLNAVNSFDADKGVKFSSYAEVCVTNGIKSAASRLAKKSEEILSENIDGETPDGESPENIWFEKEKMSDIYSEIESLLSKKEWSIFKLYMGGLSYREIASRLDIPPKSVDNAVFRVRKKLRTLFSQGK